MSALPQPYRIGEAHERELAERLRLAEECREPVLLEIAGARYRLVPEAAHNDIRLADENDPFANYDPDRARAAIEAGFRALQGIDVDAFLAEIRKMRIQDSSGRLG